MGENFRRLPDSMLEIMLAVWEAGEPVTSLDISRRLKNKKEWTLTSILTFLSRLVERGYLSIEKRGRLNVYTALISERTYLEREGKTLLERLYGNSLCSFVASMYNGSVVGDEDLEELKRFIEDKEKG